MITGGVSHVYPINVYWKFVFGAPPPVLTISGNFDLSLFTCQYSRLSRTPSYLVGGTLL